MKVLAEIMPKTIGNLANNVKKETALLDFLYRDTLLSTGNKKVLRKRGSDRIKEEIKEILGLNVGTKESREETEEELRGDAYEEALRKAKKVMDELDSTKIR